jgi:hypothetical protein
MDIWTHRKDRLEDAGTEPHFSRHPARRQGLLEKPGCTITLPIWKGLPRETGFPIRIVRTLLLRIRWALGRTKSDPNFSSKFLTITGDPGVSFLIIY